MAALVVYAIILQPVESSGRQGIKISKMTVPNGDLDLALQQLTKTLPSDVPHIQAVLRDMVSTGSLVIYRRQFEYFLIL